MKANHIIILSLAVFAVCLLAIPQPCLGEDRWKEDMRREENIRRSLIERHKMGPEKIEEMLQHIAERNPEKAKELKILRKENPAEFRKAMQQMFAKKHDRQKEAKSYQGEHEKRRFDAQAGERRSSDRSGRSDRGTRGRRSDRITHDQILSWLKENYPRKAEKLVRLRKKKPELFGRMVGKYGRIAEVDKENPQLGNALKRDLELKEKKYKILKKLKNTTDEKERKQLTAELKEVVSYRFNVILRRKKLVYNQMLRKLEELKKEVEKHKTELDRHNNPDFKNKNINARLQELLVQSEEFQWD